MSDNSDPPPPRWLQIAIKVGALPHGVDAQQADHDIAMVLLQECVTHEVPVPQELVDRLASYMNRDLDRPDREPRMEIEGIEHQSLAAMVRPMAKQLGIHPNSVKKYYEAAKCEAEQRRDDPDGDVSISKIAEHAGVQRSTIRQWQGDGGTDDAQRRRRSNVWRAVVGHILSEPEQLNPTPAPEAERRKFELITNPEFEDSVIDSDDD
ncbi:MAG: hypothetical protein HOJ20_16205 [Rhodospirillaceae bacterium]|jgi:hypothetical protein|nr:hypothetical protein [Rhodospirillaceae bacterium]